ncbi:MAG: S1 RNA-binding domain-containing protein [Lachnospiraceae bacterium]|nr:S1 RNA-binding domain-containing protein [Lachnospiraceae bacterium]
MAESKAPKRVRASKVKEEKLEVESIVSEEKEDVIEKELDTTNDATDDTTDDATDVVIEQQEDAVETENNESESSLSDELVSEEDVEVEKNISAEVFGEDEEELPIEFDEVDKAALQETKKAEQEDLAKKMSKSLFVSDEEELLDKKLLEAGRKKKKELYSDAVIPLHDEVQYVSNSVIRKNEFLNLVDSMHTGRILYGTVVGIEMYCGMVSAVVKYGEFFRTIIPFDYFTTLTKDDEKLISKKGNNKSVSDAIKRKHIEDRIMSEVDFIVGKIDEENGIAIANRISAMNRKKISFFFSRSRNGEYGVKEGMKAEARIVRATSNYLYAELYGIEFKLSAEDIASVHIADVSEMYPVGTTAPVKILKLDREKKGKNYSIKVKVSIKEGMEDRRLSCFNFYSKGSRVLATVTGVETYGIFCRLEGANGVLDVLCSYPTNEFIRLPHVGSLVAVRITSKDEENIRLNGQIVKVLNYGD